MSLPDPMVALAPPFVLVFRDILEEMIIYQ